MKSLTVEILMGMEASCGGWSTECGHPEGHYNPETHEVLDNTLSTWADNLPVIMGEGYEYPGEWATFFSARAWAILEPARFRYSCEWKYFRALASLVVLYVNDETLFDSLYDCAYLAGVLTPNTRASDILVSVQKTYVRQDEKSSPKGWDKI